MCTEAQMGVFMDFTLRIFVMSISVFIFASVICKLVKHQLNESNSILWILIGFLTLISGCFPDLVNWIARLVGIDYPPTLLFLVSTIVLMFITFKNSIHISKNESKISELAITLSILREENRWLREMIDINLCTTKNMLEGNEEL